MSRPWQKGGDPQDSPCVGIIVVNWNTCRDLECCLASVENTRRGTKVQVIVVDNGSFDGSAELVARRFSWAEFLQLPENVGFGRANNLAFEKVRAPLTLFLNPDAELLPGALESMIRAMHALPDAGLIGPKILNADGSLQVTCVRRLPTVWNRCAQSAFLERRWLRRTIGEAENPVEVECVSGACMLVRSEVFRTVQGFSPEFFIYGEDVDLCFKVRALRWRIYYVPEAAVIHAGGKSSAKQFSRFSAVGVRAAEHAVLKKWRGVVSAALYRCLLALGAVVRIFCLACILTLRGGEGAFSRCRIGIQKWWAILRWCLGRERWADELFRPRAARDTGLEDHVAVQRPGAGANL